MPNGPSVGPGWGGHFFTGVLGAVTTLFGAEAWKEMRGELKDTIKKAMDVDRQLYTVTLMVLERRAPDLANIIKQRRKTAETKPFGENRQVRLITKLLKAFEDKDPHVWEKRVVAMIWLALQGDDEFEGTLNGIENDNARQAARMIQEGWRLVKAELDRTAQSVADTLQPMVRGWNKELKKMVRAKHGRDAANPLPQTARERRQYIIKRKGFFRWLIGG